MGDILWFFLLMRGSALYSFTQQFDLAIEDLQRALDMVQSHRFSLVPPLADGLPELSESDSEATLLQELGSTLQCHGLDQESGLCLKKYVQMIGEEQPDHYCLPKACYELALVNTMTIDGSGFGELSFWIQKAKHFEEKRLFVFPAYESQKKMIAENMFAVCGKGNGKKHGKGYEKGFRQWKSQWGVFMSKTPFTLSIRCEFSCGFVFPKKVLYDLNVSCWKKWNKVLKICCWKNLESWKCHPRELRWRLWFCSQISSAQSMDRQRNKSFKSWLNIPTVTGRGGPKSLKASDANQPLKTIWFEAQLL